MAIDAHRTLEVEATPDCLDDIHELISALASEAGLPDDIVIRFESAAMEIVANIIEHGAAAQSVRLSISVRITAGWVRGELIDDAPAAAFDVAGIDMPDPMADRGRGLAIAIHLLDDFEYTRAGERNEWRLGVQLPSEKS